MKKLSLPITIVVILVVGYLVFFARQANDQNGTVVQQPPVNGTTIDTSDWKTYRNEQYRFEVRYPNDWYLTAPNLLGEPYLNLPAGPITFTNYDLSSLTTSFPQIPSWAKIDIYIGLKPQNWSLGNFAEENFLSPQVMKVADLDAIQGILKPSQGEGGPPLQVFSTVFAKDNLVFSISMIGDIEGQRDFYNRIVQLLKFI